MNYTVWLCAASRIASFHPVEGFREQRFLNHPLFLNYLQELQNQGYKFQDVPLCLLRCDFQNFCYVLPFDER